MTDDIRTALIEKCRKALRRTGTAYDDEISDAIDAALIDLGIAGITNVSESDKLVIKAIKIFVKMDSGDFNDEYKDLKAAYDELKSEMGMNSQYTTFEETSEEDSNEAISNG